MLEWDDASIVGMQRWLGKVWRIVTALAERTDDTLMRQAQEAQEREFDVTKMNKEERELWKAANTAIKDVSVNVGLGLRLLISCIFLIAVISSTRIQVTQAFSATYSFNTAIAELIKLTNSLVSAQAASPAVANSHVYIHTVEMLVKMMAPMAPGTGEECWEVLCTWRGGENTKQPASVFREKWPVWDESALVTDKAECVVQVGLAEIIGYLIPIHNYINSHT